MSVSDEDNPGKTEPTLSTGELCRVNYEAINICERSHLPPIYAQDIVALYSEQKKKKIHSFKNCYSEKLLAVSFYEICKNESVPRTLKEISAFSDIPEDKLSSALKEYFPFSEPIQPQQIIHRLAQNCGIPRRYAQRLKIFMDVYLPQCPPHSFSPITVAGAIIKIAKEILSLDISLQAISDICGVSTIGIRRFLKFLESCHFSKDIPLKELLQPFLSARSENSIKAKLTP